VTVIDASAAHIPADMTIDLYRDIHKGIRSELFAVTMTAGRLDPSDRAGRSGLAGHVRSVVTLLIEHSDREDGALQPVLERELPALAERIELDHAAIDARLVPLQDLADGAVEVAHAEQRPALHRLYLELSSFTAVYLRHQDVEEQVVMPALEQSIGPDAVVGIHQAVIAAIEPEEMARSLAVMLPAMNIDDRAAMLGGMRAEAPAEVFAGIWGLAGSVLTAPDQAALAARLGI
jgi:hypothetical protein